VKHVELAMVMAAGMLCCYGQTTPAQGTPAPPVSAAAAAVDAPNSDEPVGPFWVGWLPRPAPEPFQTITSKERLGLYVSGTYSVFGVLGAASGGAISQWMNSPKEWGQGWDAYGKRVAGSYGSTLVGNTITYGTSAILHEDNRYYRSHSSSFMGRLGTVIVSPYLAKNDAGKTRFSASQFLGSAGYSTLPLYWSPGSWQGAGNVAINYSIWYGVTAGFNLVREFYPSLVAHYKGKRAAKH
jgi:hypothetical protein